MIKQIIITHCKEYSIQLQNRVPGFVAERCRWQMQRGEDAQRSKYGVTPPYFGHRKRGCEATSSPFVYHRQSCGDNHCFSFTAILLVFPILIKLRRTVFSVRRFFIFSPFFIHFVPHNPPNPFGTSSKKHQSQFKSVCNAHQHIRVSFYIIHFGYLRSCVSK